MPVSVAASEYSPSCNSCGDKTMLVDISVGRQPGGNGGMTITLCLYCRYELHKKLRPDFPGDLKEMEGK